jgi:hypothetical protein
MFTLQVLASNLAIAAMVFSSWLAFELYLAHTNDWRGEDDMKW